MSSDRAAMMGNHMPLHSKLVPLGFESSRDDIFFARLRNAMSALRYPVIGGPTALRYPQTPWPYDSRPSATRYIRPIHAYIYFSA